MLNRHIGFRTWKLFIAVCACFAASTQLARAQSQPPVILEVDIENMVQYFGDVSDPSKLATSPAATNPALATFEPVLLIADIAAVNGRPMKGTWVARTQRVPLRPMTAPGVAIADVVRNGPGDEVYEILQPDGTPVGTIVSLGFFGGPRPPGTPSTLTSGNHAIVGGTGAFSGIRGEDGGGVALEPVRSASFSEDPANRRVKGVAKCASPYILFPRPGRKSAWRRVLQQSSIPATSVSSTPLTQPQPERSFGCFAEA